MNLLAPIQKGFDSLTGRFSPGRFYPRLLLLLVAAGLFPLLYPGIPMGHDLNFHLARIQGIAEGLRAGCFPVLINPTALNGYGYATGLFYPDLFLYPVALLAVSGMNLVSAYKLFLFFWALFTAWTMYYAAVRVTRSPRTGFIAGLLYCWSSYFAVDLLNRAALGEVLAFPFIPLILLGVYELIYGNPRYFAPMTIGFTGILLSHNITTVLMTLILLVWFGCCIGRLLKEPRRIGWTVLSGIFAIAFSLYYLIPMFEQLSRDRFYLTETTLGGTIAERAVPLTRLFLELPYMKMEYWIPSGIGMIFLIVLLQRLRIRSRFQTEDFYRDALLIGGVSSLFAATNLLPWEGLFRGLASIQFPWRFYLPATAFLALGGALTLSSLIGPRQFVWRRWFFILLCGCAFAWFFNVFYLYAAKIHEKSVLRVFKDAGKRAASGLHYLPRSVELASLLERGDTVRSENPIVCSVNRPSASVLKVVFSENRTENRLELPLVAYYGYSARMDGNGRNLQLGRSKAGFLNLELPSELSSGSVSVRYTGTRLQKISGTASVLAFLLFLAVCFSISNRRPEKNAKNI